MMHYLYNADGSYVGAYDTASLVKAPEDCIEGPAPASGADKFLNGQLIPGAVPTSLNPLLEAAFLQILPKHLNQPYLTDAVISDMMKTKVAVFDANTIDPSGSLGKALTRSLNLPLEMQEDKSYILSLFP